MDLFRCSKPDNKKWDQNQKLIMNQKAERLQQLLVQKYGGIYVQKMLETMVNDMPVGPVIDEMCESFYGIIKNYPVESVAWFANGLQNVPFNVLNQNEKESFVMNMSQHSIEDNWDYYSGFFNKYIQRCYKFSCRNGV